MTKLTQITRLIAVATLMATPFAARDAQADLAPVQPATMQVSISPWIPIECSYHPGTEFPKVFVKNPTSATIPKGTSVRYTLAGATTTTTTVTLSSDLPAGAETPFTAPSLVGQIACKGAFDAGAPDIVVKHVQWADQSTATVAVANANPWIPTGAFSVRVRSFACVSVPVKSVDSPSITLAKGELKFINVAIPKPGATYLTATADVDNKVKEANENNNTATSSDAQACAPK